MTYENLSELTLDDINGDSLEHHGVLGQKWGVRRYQNEDGSLTPAGKEHYYGKGRITRSNKRIAKYSKQLETANDQEAKVLKQRIQTEKDRNAFREKVKERHEVRTTGSKVLHNLLLGPYANLAVNNMREAGYSDLITYGATIGAGLLASPLLGNAVVARLAMNDAINKRNAK